MTTKGTVGVRTRLTATEERPRSGWALQDGRELVRWSKRRLPVGAYVSLRISGTGWTAEVLAEPLHRSPKREEGLTLAEAQKIAPRSWRKELRNMQQLYIEDLEAGIDVAKKRLRALRAGMEDG